MFIDRLKVGLAHLWGRSPCTVVTFSGTHRGDLEGLASTGRKISVVACSVLEAEGGAIKREAAYFDTSSLLAQLGQ